MKVKKTFSITAFLLMFAVFCFMAFWSSNHKVINDWLDGFKNTPIVREVTRTILVEDKNVEEPKTVPPKEVASGKFPLLPDPSKTPGTTLPNVDARIVCVPGYAKSKRDVSQSLKRRVFERYGFDGTETKFEVDHLISLQLGGGNAIENLWPQAYTSEPWNAHDKDRLENKLHWLVCKGQISLEEAQQAIRGDWIKSYAKYIGARVRK